MDPEGRTIVVTGAAGGIGGALVEGLLDRGAGTVLATDLDAAGLERFDDRRVVPRALDVTDEQATRALVDEAGPIDIFFANAGLATGGGVDAPDEDWERQWRVNVMPHVYAARALLPGWTERGEGHLITTASMAGILTTLGDGVYAATKHAAVGFAEWLAITHAADGIKVSCICPGAVDTAMLRGSTGDAKTAAAVIGGGGVLSAEDAAARVVEAVRNDAFLILTHPEMHEYMERKSSDTDRWIRGMSRQWERTKDLLGCDAGAARPTGRSGGRRQE